MYHLPIIHRYAALAGVAQWIENWPENGKITSSIPSQGTGLGPIYVFLAY